jgi:RNA polymerase II subunit A-like phosphatase
MSELVPITLPQSVPFPVTISSILCKNGDTVPKHKTIFKYKYWDYQDDPNSREEVPPKIRVERIGTFESPIEGEIELINVKHLQEIAHSGIELCYIKEPCSHTVQYGGLCALCGKAVEDEKDYSGYNYEERATIAMSHDNTGLKISLDEATKIEESTTTRLVQDKKLILVVDLDQTVIQATVDPTVGEWQLDPSNPNYPAIKDVKSFCLEEDGPQGFNTPKKCWYYVKIRPGLAEFLQEVSKKYEMHIYTMATRNYALAIARIIDPDGKYFGDRILSRDESGSLTHKNLKRLFPVDQSMVVIIDDRGDVWQWESNLIKVVPYNFFVGIGDINSTFLPKKNSQLSGPSKKRKSIAKLEAQQASPESDLEPDTTFEENGTVNEIESVSPVERILELGGGEDNTELLLAQSMTRIQSIEKQQHDRPLAKLQHNLEQMHHHDHDSKSPSPVGSPDNSDEEDEEDNLLFDDDNELYSLKRVLGNIHKEYYKALEANKNIADDYRPDLTEIIPIMKSQILSGITVLFSGIIPLTTNFENEDI